MEKQIKRSITYLENRGFEVAEKKKGINWLRVGFILFVLMVGVICGIALGIKTGQMILFEGMGVALADSNINVTIDLNETIIIEGVKEIAEEVLIPFLNNSEVLNKK